MTDKRSRDQKFINREIDEIRKNEEEKHTKELEEQRAQQKKHPDSK